MSKRAKKSRAASPGSASTSAAAAASPASAATDEVVMPEHLPGSIIKIELDNFMTYEHIVIQPGPRVNLVIGPNGAGKSSILCAVVIGLGGEPKLTGRSTSLSEFIRKSPEAQKARIRITLKREVGYNDTDPQIERIFSKGSNQSEWKLNGKVASRRAIQDVIHHYQIQVDSLTQFLAQDIVGNFSKYDPQKMLEETVRAALGQKYLDEFNEIKELHYKHCNASGIEKQLEVSVQSLEADVKELDDKHTRFLEIWKKKIQLQLLRSKRPWVQSEEFRVQAKEAKAEKERTKKEWESHMKQVAPKQEEVKAAEKKLRKAEQDEKMAYNKYKKAAAAASNQFKKKQTATMEHGICHDEIRSETEEQFKAQGKMEKIRELTVKYEKQLEEMPSEKEDDAEWARLMPSFRKATQALRIHERKMKQVNRKIEDVQNDIENQKRAIDKATNRGNQRIKKFGEFVNRNSRFRVAQNAWYAAKSLHVFKNKHAERLHGKVLGPTLVEVESRDPAHAKSLENAIGVKWMYAFTFTDQRDYDTLKRFNQGVWGRITYAVVNESRLMSNAQMDEQRPLTEAQVNSLKGNGIIGYADKLISGEPVVFEMLCRKANLHKRLISQNESISSQSIKTLLDMATTTQNNRNRRQSGSGARDQRFRDEVRVLTNTSSSSVRVARFGPPTEMVDMKQLSASGLLEGMGNTDNSNKVKAYQEAKQRLEKEIIDLKAEREQLQQEKSALIKEEALAKEISVSVRDRKKQRTKLRNTIARAMNGLQKCEKTLRDSERQVIKQKEKAASLRKTLWKLNTPDEITDQLEAMMNLHKVRLNTVAHRQEYERHKAELEFMESQFGHIKKKYEEASASCKALIQKLHQCNKRGVELVNALPKDPNNPKLGNWKCVHKRPNDKQLVPPEELIRGPWQELPKDVPTIDARIDNRESDIEADTQFYQENQDVVQKLSEKKRKCEEARKKLSDHRKGNNEQAAQLELRKSQWQEKIETMVSKINVKFQKLMMGKTRNADGYERAAPGTKIPQVPLKGELACKGAVELDIPSDFGKAGITIKVAFRGETRLEPLNVKGQQLKSGGERAISTIMYLLAVQQLKKRPIRMIDEINQGMDEHNERHACNAIGRISESSQGTTQFFLFSPKLLMNEKRFDYPKSMTVMLIHKGKFMIPGEQWDLDGFLNSLKKSRKRKSPN